MDRKAQIVFAFSVEDNALVQPHFTTTPLVRYHAQTFLNICQGAQIRAIRDFHFCSKIKTYEAKFSTLQSFTE